MPVIIQEIHITAEVGSQSSAQSEGAPAAPAMPQADIVAVCVEEVLRIIHEKAER
ncbi:hypothetical protein GFS24_23815 [Chitinophaga sp. SYP-B3965]|uniref:DUF5908 family protein n=1 Tax=Chitinophaga sp. SYP-B3965 TaxID=2663120 RepID=UPI001299BEDB|nr:DUF5908 family protein [Chitinophaga sp. SYP-B3965]MRG48168.1 hypothetical protein [Chitinophaga sp. SYP-B3965]